MLWTEIIRLKTADPETAGLNNLLVEAMRHTAKEPGLIEARVYNHGGSPRQASAELRAPSGWRIQKAGSITIPPHTEGKIQLRGIVPLKPSHRREVLGLAVHFGNRNLGEAAEAIVDYLD